MSSSFVIEMSHSDRAASILRFLEHHRRSVSRLSQFIGINRTSLSRFIHNDGPMTDKFKERVWTAVEPLLNADEDSPELARFVDGVASPPMNERVCAIRDYFNSPGAVTRTWAANHMGVRPDQISHFLSGRRSIPSAVAERICENMERIMNDPPPPKKRKREKVVALSATMSMSEVLAELIRHGVKEVTISVDGVVIAGQF
jgi:plasmid maintenance system antidote protein VapI